MNSDTDIRNAFVNMTDNCNPDRVESLTLTATGGVRRKPINPVKLAAVATAAVMLLTVSVFAAAKLVGIIITPNDFTDYVVEYELSPQNLPDSVKARLVNYCGVNTPEKAAFEFGKAFDSWREASDWLGLPLPDNRLLGDLPDSVTEGEKILLTSYMRQSGEEIEFVSVAGLHKVIGYDESCSVSVYVPLTEAAANSGNMLVTRSADMTVVDGVLNIGETNPDATNESYEYILQNGIQAEIVVTSYPQKLYSDVTYTRWTAAAYFVYDGIGYNVESSCNVYPEKTEYIGENGVKSIMTFPESGNPDETVELVKAVLEAFEF